MIYFLKVSSSQNDLTQDKISQNNLLNSFLSSSPFFFSQINTLQNAPIAFWIALSLFHSNVSKL